MYAMVGKRQAVECFIAWLTKLLLKAGILLLSHHTFIKYMLMLCDKMDGANRTHPLQTVLTVPETFYLYSNCERMVACFTVFVFVLNACVNKKELM